jgi:N-acetylornithine carbamoyltransferase
MQTGLRGRDLIALSDWTNEEIETAIDVGFELKRKRALGERHANLLDKTLAMLFFFSSTRTRASFEAGMAQLGGHAMFMESRTTQIAHGDTAKEIGEILGRYNDGIAIRHVTPGEGNEYIRAVAEASRVPVLNMQCEIYHPFQILADLMTIIEKKGRLKGQSITISWAYASSYQKPISVPQSLLLAATRFGMDVKLVHPPEFELMPSIMFEAEANAAGAGGKLERLTDFDAGFDGADIVYAKSWGAPLLGVSDEEGAKIGAKYTDWISDERRMAMTKHDAIWMHPLPADRGVEVADAVIDGPKSAAFDEAENRLHAQKAVMALTMG